MKPLPQNRIAEAGTLVSMPVDVVGTARELAQIFDERATAHDRDDTFVAENYTLLKESGLVSAAVPRELGGGGAEIRELCEMLRIIGQACGSTGLAFAMHTHQVAIPAWRWRHQNVTAVEPLLKRVASDRIVLLSSGGSDWIGGSGKAEKVEGGYRINARKVFTSGAAAGDVLMTGAILDTDDGCKVIHFGAPMHSDAVKVQDNWRTLGMRGTGSNDVLIEDLFVAEAGVSFSRQSGHWHPVFQIIATVAFPLIYAVYVGVAEKACALAVAAARKRPPNQHTTVLAGRMTTALRGVQLAHRAMVDVVEKGEMSADSVNEVMIGRSLVARLGLEAVDLAMELGGGASFFRANGIERCFRDMQAARFHPLQQGPQAQYAGAIALGLPTAEIF